jgi:hypothetical protein
MPKKKELEYTIDNNNCHICISHKPNSDGYPYLHIKGNHWRASRWVYTLKNGEIPLNLIIRHTCDNRLCINPEHLIAGTQKENAQDRVQRNRNRNQSGENNNMNKLSELQVKEILNLNLSNKQIAAKYNVSRQAIEFIKNGKRWKHITI